MSNPNDSFDINESAFQDPDRMIDAMNNGIDSTNNNGDDAKSDDGGIHDLDFLNDDLDLSTFTFTQGTGVDLSFLGPQAQQEENNNNRNMSHELSATGNQHLNDISFGSILGSNNLYDSEEVMFSDDTLNNHYKDLMVSVQKTYSLLKSKIRESNYLKGILAANNRQHAELFGDNTLTEEQIRVNQSGIDLNTTILLDEDEVNLKNAISKFKGHVIKTFESNNKNLAAFNKSVGELNKSKDDLIYTMGGAGLGYDLLREVKFEKKPKPQNESRKMVRIIKDELVKSLHTEKEKLEKERKIMQARLVDTEYELGVYKDRVHQLENGSTSSMDDFNVFDQNNAENNIRIDDDEDNNGVNNNESIDDTETNEREEKIKKMYETAKKKVGAIEKEKKFDRIRLITEINRWKSTASDLSMELLSLKNGLNQKNGHNGSGLKAITLKDNPSQDSLYREKEKYFELIMSEVSALRTMVDFYQFEKEIPKSAQIEKLEAELNSYKQDNFILSQRNTGLYSKAKINLKATYNEYKNFVKIIEVMFGYRLQFKGNGIVKVSCVGPLSNKLEFKLVHVRDKYKLYMDNGDSVETVLELRTLYDVWIKQRKNISGFFLALRMSQLNELVNE
ncbi:hypothetical protein K502DRAFT_368829 [Neoconidiobolus thromboides FSU 785]|nr:hypothetical protein K502DRAFT_368829 [Neoconidiobolus thromboides FSU 785]